MGPHRGATALVVAIVLLGSLPLATASGPAGIDPGRAGDVTVSGDDPSPGQAAPRPGPINRSAGGPVPESKRGAAATGGSARRLTLLTGETVAVRTVDGATTVRVVDGGPIHQVEADGRRYLLPTDADLGVYDRSVFALEALLGANGTLPVLLSVDGPVDPERLAPLDDVRRLESAGVVAATVRSARGRAAIRELVASGAVDRVAIDRSIEHAGWPSRAVGGPGALHPDGRPPATRNASRPNGSVAGAGVTVAVLDTGIDATHPDLDDRVVERFDLVDGEAGPLDPNGHGTVVAGVVAGTGPAGTTGVAPAARLLDVRVMDEDGGGTTSTIVAGIERAVAADADVILLSIATNVDRGGPIAESVEWAADRGVVVVAAAGNLGRPRTIGAPGRPPAAITVGAMDERGGVASYSSRGPTIEGHLKPDLVAPGAGVVGPRSAQSDRYAIDDDGQYTQLAGTSVAAPRVAGAAARLLATEPGLGPEAVESRLASTARPIEGEGTYAQGAGVLDVERALDPAVLVTPGVVDFGILATDGVATRTVTLVNRDDRPHRLDLSAGVRNADLDRPADGVVSLNRTTLSLAPGERAGLRIVVDGDTPPGAHAGALRFRVDGEPRTVPVGFLRGGRITVEKRPLSAGGRVDRDELWVLNEEGVHDELLEFENGTASFVAGGGTYLLWSAGTDESTGATVFLSERARFDGPGRVVLDEADTVPVGVDAAPLRERHGPLANRSVAVSLSTVYGEERARRSLLRKDTASRTVRVSRDPHLDVATAHLLVPETGGGAPLDAADVFYLVTAHDGVLGPDVEEASPAGLATTTHRYHRRTVDETYAVRDRATVHAVWNRPARRSFGLGDRRVQRIHRFPGVADYHRTLRGAGWRAERSLPDGALAHPERDAEVVQVLSHPMLAGLDVNEGPGGTVTIRGAPFVDGDGTRYRPDGNHSLSVRVGGALAVQRQVGGTVGRLATVRRAPDESVAVRLVGGNDGGRLSTRTLTEVRLPPRDRDGRRPLRSDRPPTITDLRVVGTDAANAIAPGDATVVVESDLVGVLDDPTIWYATGPVGGPPWENASGWTSAPARRRGDTAVTTLRLPAGAETVHLAAAVSDVWDRRARTMTMDAVHVGEAPNTSTADLAGRLLAADGTPAANDTVLLRRVTTGERRVLRTDRSGRFSVELPRGRRYELAYVRGGLGSPARPSPSGRPAWWPIGRVTIDAEPGPGTVRLPRAGRLNVTVTDQRGEPVAGATVRLRQRRGNASVTDVLPTDGTGRIARFGSDRPGIDLAGPVNVTVGPPSSGPYAQRSYRRAVTVAGPRTVEVVLETLPPRARLTAYGRFEPGEPVFLDAGTSRVPAEVAEYRWDVDGDGAVDRVTADPVVRYVPPTGASEPTLIVVDEAGKTDTSSLVLQIGSG